MSDENTRKKLSNKMGKMIDKWDLRYNFGSIYYCLEIEGVSLEQCANCYFFGESEDDNDIEKSVERATKILVTAGLYDYEKRNYEEASAKAVKYISDWHKSFGNIVLLHMTLISILKSRHFFSESLVVVPVALAQRIENLCRAAKAKAWVKQKLAQ